MLFEKPILVSNCIPQQQIINESNCGLTFESGNAEDLCEKVIFLLKNPELCKQYGQNGKESVLRKYNLNYYGMNLKSLYDSI